MAELQAYNMEWNYSIRLQVIRLAARPVVHAGVGRGGGGSHGRTLSPLSSSPADGADGEHRSTEEKQRLLPEYLSANAAALLTAARGERGHGAGDDGAVEAAVAAAGTDAVDRVAL